MTDILSLEQLIHLSLGDPEAGAVNFNILKTVLLQMLKAMNIYNYQPVISDSDQHTIKEALSKTPVRNHVRFEQNDSDIRSNDNNGANDDIKQKAQQRTRDRSLDRLTTLEEKVTRMESQLHALNQMPSNSELIDRTKRVSRKTLDDYENSSKLTNRQGPILEVWQYTQLEKRLESAENGITRLASLLEDLIADMNDLKDSNETMKNTTEEVKQQHNQLKDIVDKLNREKNDWAKKSEVESLEERMRNLQNLLASLKDRLDDLSQTVNNGAPLPDFTDFVTWDRLEDALRGLRESVENCANDAAAALASTRNKRQSTPKVETLKDKIEKVDRASSARSAGLPSTSLSDLLEKLGTLNDRHEQLRALVQALERNKLNRDEFETYKNRQNDLFDRLAALEQDINKISSKQRTTSPNVTPTREFPSQNTDYTSDISDFRKSLQRLREDLDRLKQSLQELINKGNLNSQDIDTLRRLIEQLDQTKADKITVNDELDKKADKRDVDNRVSKKDFNSACNELSQNINDYMQKFNAHEDIQERDINKINRDVEGKIDRSELESLHDNIDRQLKKMKKLLRDQPAQQQLHIMSEDEAAGFRKQLIRFHCISCDRPIDMQTHPQQPSLPANQGMRPIQSPRPYTTYELDQIRQFQKSQQFSNELSGGLNDVYATVRQCGGSHTMTLPFKRQVKTQPTVPEEGVLSRSEVDIKGHDGVIYKGRIDVSKLPTVDTQKKNSVVLLAPPPQRPRSDSHPKPAKQQSFHETSENKNEELTRISSAIPNLEQKVLREDTFA